MDGSAQIGTVEEIGFHRDAVIGRKNGPTLVNRVACGTPRLISRSMAATGMTGTGVRVMRTGLAGVDIGTNGLGMRTLEQNAHTAS